LKKVTKGSLLSAYGEFIDAASIYAGGSNQKSEGRVGILDGKDRAKSSRNGGDKEASWSIAIVVDHQR